MHLRSDRLTLRPFDEADIDLFAAMNADPEVMATIGAPLDREDAAAMLGRAIAGFRRDGFGLLAVCLHGEMIGWTGLLQSPFHPEIEIGWRFRSAFWGNGYATEAAHTVLQWGFADNEVGGRGLREVVSFTASVNTRSQAVMQRLGMRYDPTGDFSHPNIAEDNPLNPHVLYRLSAAEYAASL